MSLLQSRHKAEVESRQQEEKKTNDRRRNLIILIEKYLLELGYLDSCMKLQNESTISLDKWDAADNIDLYSILTEYETFYEMKFAKPPKIVKKLGPGENTNALPKLITSKSNNQIPDSKTKKKSVTPAPKNSKEEKENIKENKKENNENGFEIEIKGNSVGKQIQNQSEEEDFFDNRILKALPPDLLEIPDLKELAQYLQRDICIENPNVKFTDIVGLEKAKGLLKEAVQLPLKYPHLFVGLLEPWRGVLLFGPPGTGKTLLAKAVATECKTTFFNISASSIVSKWRGDSEKLVRVLFELARHHQPSTIFLDEIDSIMGQRSGSSGSEHEASRRMKTELLIQMDGLIKNKERVFLLAASNLPWDLDVAMLRRLEKRILVPLPDEPAREAMLRKFLPNQIDKFDFQGKATKLKNYSGSDIKLVCKEAAMKPLRRLIKYFEETNISQKNAEKMSPEPATDIDFNEALETTKPTMLIASKKYEKWEKEYGSI